MLNLYPCNIDFLLSSRLSIHTATRLSRIYPPSVPYFVSLYAESLSVQYSFCQGGAEQLAEVTQVMYRIGLVLGRKEKQCRRRVERKSLRSCRIGLVLGHKEKQCRRRLERKSLRSGRIGLSWDTRKSNVEDGWRESHSGHVE
jgi:hypothetical protein